MNKYTYLILILLFQLSKSNATTYTVSGNGWAGTGAGTSGDLLWCFNQVNSTAGGPHTISFAGLAGSPTVITFTSRVNLNSANADGLTINGETSPGWTCGTPNIVFVGGWMADLTLTNRSHITIKAICMQSFDLTISGGSFNNIYGCWFNLNSAGTGRQGSSGAYLANMFTITGSTDNVIGGTTCNTRNVFNHGTSPYAWTGFVTLSSADRTSIVGNYFGTDKTGNVSLGPTAATGTNNITISGTANALIAQNVITSIDGAGIAVAGTCPSLTISNNMIGVGQNGTGAAAYSNNADGILIAGTLNSLLITNNVISNNVGLANAATRGIDYTGTSNKITISNNMIGSNSTGLNDGTNHGNQNGGIVINGGTTTNLTINSNLIVRNGWGTKDNNSCGVYIVSKVDTVTINNNTIGVYANYDTTNAGNSFAGIYINSASTKIGISNNVIGNNGNGVAQKSHGIAFAAGPSNIQIYGNYVGVDPSGNNIGNYANGIELNPASNVIIGDTAVGQRNYIGFNKGANLASGFPRAGGIALIAGTSNVTIRNNSIGVGPTGAAAGQSNFNGTSSVNYGIFAEGTTSHVYIGGIYAKQGNIVAYSGGNGIFVFAGTYVQMRENSIYCNTLKGIAITAGANNGITPPVINTLTTAPTAGYLNQVNGTAGNKYIVEIFTTNICSAACNANPQGQSLIDTVTASATGVFNYTSGSTIFNFISATQTVSGCLTSKLATDNCYTSEFSTCISNTLPITWVSFIAQKKGSAVLLDWVTGSEKNAGIYVVERSLDGKTFEDIATIDALNETSGGNYTYTDYNNFSGKMYYRIREVDIDGTADLSIIRVVYSTEGNSLSIAPNPTNGMVSIKLYNGEVSDIVSIQLYNPLGQEVYATETTSGALVSGASIDMSNLSNGAYIVKITTLNTKWIERIVKD
jgi:hypothetical protein